MIFLEKKSVQKIKKILIQHTQSEHVQIENPHLYLDGLLVEKINVSNHIILKNVLFQDQTIKQVETVEIKYTDLQQVFAQPLPFDFYEQLKIKYLTIKLPFLGEEVAFNGKLKTLQKSDQSSFYQIDFKSNSPILKASGFAKFSIANGNIDHIDVTIDQANINHAMLKARRISGWWHYNRQDGNPVFSFDMGSADWLDKFIFNDLQISLNNRKMTFSSDLLNQSGRLDGDLILSDKPHLKFSFKQSDNFYDLEIDYQGVMSKDSDQWSVTSNPCLNIAVTLNDDKMILKIPEKQCFSFKEPTLQLNDIEMLQNINLSAQNIPYIFEYAGAKPKKGMIGDLNINYNHLDDILIDFKKGTHLGQNASLSKIKDISGRIAVNKNLILKAVNFKTTHNAQEYQIDYKDREIYVTHIKSGQRVLSLKNSRVDETNYLGNAALKIPIQYLDTDFSKGELTFQGTMNFNLFNPLEKITGSGTLKIIEADFIKGDLYAYGLNSQIEVLSIWPVMTAGVQNLQIDQAKLGVLDFKDVNFEFEKSKAELLIHNIQLNMLDQKWSWQDGVLSAKNISSENLLNESVFAGLIIKPNLFSGHMTVDINADYEPILKSVFFKAEQNGVISYSGKNRPNFLNRGNDYEKLRRIRNILLDMRFNKLQFFSNHKGQIERLVLNGIASNINHGQSVELDLKISNEY